MDVRTAILMCVLYSLGLCLAPLPACGGTRDAATPDQAHLDFGTKFPFVVRLLTVPHKQAVPGELTQRFGCAVAIRPNWILTAAHVVDGTHTAVVTLHGKQYPLTAVIQHPEYAANTHGTNDLALGYSPEAFGLEFYPALYTKRDELNKQATLAGFGWAGTFQTGGVIEDGKRRAGSNIVSEIGPGMLLCDARRQNRTALEMLICPGDSGGGLFIGNELAGINACLVAHDGAADGTEHDLAAFARVSLSADWVESEIQKHEAAQHPGITR